jgi:hypothetical protein
MKGSASAVKDCGAAQRARVKFKLQNSQFAIYGIDRDVASGLSPKTLSL